MVSPICHSWGFWGWEFIFCEIIDPLILKNRSTEKYDGEASTKRTKACEEQVQDRCANLWRRRQISAESSHALKGIDIDIVRALTRRLLGKEQAVECFTVSEANGINALNSKEVDVLLGGIAGSKTRSILMSALQTLNKRRGNQSLESIFKNLLGEIVKNPTLQIASLFPLPKSVPRN